ncbi:MAG: hypothetical protein ACI90V_005569 [Bacillariaceae sp.]|jgi:hypothetical protein
MADFIDIVESSRWLIDRVLSSQENDDFANLESGSTSAQQTTEIQSAASSNTNDNILNAFVNEDNISYTATSPSPFLSKSAEAELYLLATNFLVRIQIRIVLLYCFSVVHSLM